MARILTSASAVVDALGGVQDVAQQLGVVETAVYNWLRMGRFPSSRYAAMHEMLAEVPAAAPDELWAMAPRVPQRAEGSVAA